MELWFADLVQFLDRTFFDLGCRLPGDLAGFELVPEAAESCGEISETVAEGACRGVLFGLGQERMFRTNLLGIRKDMGKASLPVPADAIIGRIAVAH